VNVTSGLGGRADAGPTSNRAAPTATVEAWTATQIETHARRFRSRQAGTARILAAALLAIAAAGCSAESNPKQRGWLGVQLRPITPAAACFFQLPVAHGLLIGRTLPHSAALRAGLKAPAKPTLVVGDPWPIGGDIIVAADGHAVATGKQLSRVIAPKHRGEPVELTIYRGRAKLVAVVELGPPPSGNVASFAHGPMVGASTGSEREMHARGC
jgi:PDZ domain